MPTTLVHEPRGAAPAGDAPDAATVAAMRDTIASLEAQLIALYDERATATVAEAPLREALASMEAQLVALYDERARAAD